MLEDAQAWAAQGHWEQARRLAQQSRRLIDSWKDRDAITPDVLGQLDAIAGIGNAVPGADAAHDAPSGVTQAALHVPASRSAGLESLTASEEDADSLPTARGAGVTKTAATGPEPTRHEQPQLVIVKQEAERIGSQPPADALRGGWPPPGALVWPLGCFLAGLLALPMVALPVCLLAARFSGKGGALFRIEIIPPAAMLGNLLPQQAAIPHPDARETHESGLGACLGAINAGSSSMPVKELSPGRSSPGNEGDSHDLQPRSTADDLFGQIVAMNLDVRRAHTPSPENPRHSKRPGTRPRDTDRLLASRRMR